MSYYKQTSSGYIMAVGTGGGTEITEAEYNEILETIRNKPARTATTDYWLREDLTWEEHQIEPPDPNPEIDDSEAWDIIFGGGTA